jgi:hypothetical protein
MKVISKLKKNLWYPCDIVFKLSWQRYIYKVIFQ